MSQDQQYPLCSHALYWPASLVGKVKHLHRTIVCSALHPPNMPNSLFLTTSLHKWSQMTYKQQWGSREGKKKEKKDRSATKKEHQIAEANTHLENDLISPPSTLPTIGSWVKWNSLTEIREVSWATAFEIDVANRRVAGIQASASEAN